MNATKPLRRFLIPLIASLLVAGSVLTSGVLRRGGPKDIDARYFYVAAKCWAAGKSPYEPQTYVASFRQAFGSEPAALFVAYPPTLIPVILPMAPWTWPAAAALFSWMNFGAAMALYWACYRLVKEVVASPLTPHHWMWVVLAATVGGIGGTIFTGQSSVFVAAACALAIVGCRLNRNWLIVLGVVLGTAKPHLSAPLMLYIVLFEPKARRAVAIAAGVITVFVAYAAVVDANLVRSYLGSIHTYSTLAVNGPARLVGALPLLLRIGMAPVPAGWLALLALLLILGLTARLLRRSGEPLTQLPAALMLLTFSVAAARGIQGYDVCCYSVGIALIATLDLRYRCALLLPALLIWRPGLLAREQLGLTHNQVASFGWLGLLIGTLALATAQVRLLSRHKTAGERLP